MRKVIENQLKIGQIDIPNIQIDINCRDEIPQLLLGLQFLYSKKQVRHEVFQILKKITPKEVDADKGRPGMDLWCRDHGIKGFKRYVALAVLARNIQLIGAKIRQKSLERQRRLERIAA